MDKTYQQTKDEMIYRNLLGLCMEMTHRINSICHFAKVPLKMELIDLSNNHQENPDKELPTK